MQSEVYETVNNAEDALRDAAVKLKKLRDMGILSEAQFDKHISELVAGPPPVVAPSPPVVVQEIPRTSSDKLYAYLDEFVIGKIQELWINWSEYFDRPNPMELFGAEWMVDLYEGTMLNDMLPKIIKPIETDVELTKRYNENVLPFFTYRSDKYSNILLTNIKNNVIRYGFEFTNAENLRSATAEIEKLGGDKFASPDLIAKERRLRDTGKSMARVKQAIKRYYVRNFVFIAYLELKDIDIASVRPTEFQLFQAYINRNYERNIGKPYSATMWNDYRTRCGVFWDHLAVQKDMYLGLGLISKVPKRAVKEIERPYPVDAFKLELTGDWRLLKKQDEVLRVYKCIKDAKHPRIAKNRDLLEICFRLMRETGLRMIHLTWLRWGRLPKPDTKPVTRVGGSKVYPINYIGFDEEVVELRKNVPRERALISELLTTKILDYRKKYPERIEDGYYVLSGKTLLGWTPAEGGYRTSMLESIDLETGRPRYSNAFSTCLRWMRDACTTKFGVRVAPSRFRDAFMTLMLESLDVGAVEFQDITGDLLTTAVKRYRAPAEYIKLPEKGTLSYADVVALVFNKEE